jgi:hypothetical protein
VDDLHVLCGFMMNVLLVRRPSKTCSELAESVAIVLSAVALSRPMHTLTRGDLQWATDVSRQSSNELLLVVKEVLKMTTGRQSRLFVRNNRA